MNTTPSTRRAWLEGRYSATELTPEASPRRYFRSAHPDTRGWLRVEAPLDAPYACTDFLLEQGVRVPRLGPAVAGVYLVEDLGDVHLAHQPTLENYRAVLQLHRRYYLAALPAGHPQACLALDEALFRKELRQFEDYAITPCLARLTEGQAETLADFLPRLAQLAATGPQTLQHRDLHCRNVLLVDGEVALIDHQDLRRGPLFYDMASLQTDAYIDLPSEVHDLLQAEVARLGAAAGLSNSALQQQYFWTALQRVLKALGTFTKLQANGRDDYASAEKRAWRHVDSLLCDFATAHQGLVAAEFTDALQTLRRVRLQQLAGSPV